MNTMTLEQVKADVASGKSTSIFYAAKTCWWTHLSEDMKAATELGKQNQIKFIELRLDDPEIMEDTKRMMRQHLKALKGETDLPDFLKQIPLDPTGSPLLIANPQKFISQAEANPNFYGKYGVEALMKAHHQNCGGKASQIWGFYNDQLDLEKGVPRAKQLDVSKCLVKGCTNASTHTVQVVMCCDREQKAKATTSPLFAVCDDHLDVQFDTACPDEVFMQLVNMMVKNGLVAPVKQFSFIEITPLKKG